VEIRKANAGDVAAMLDLWRRADASPSVTDTADDVARVIAVPNSTVLLAVDGDTVVGSVIATFDGWRGNYYRLAVDPEHRREGVALQLVDVAWDWLEAAGVKRVTALVEEDRPVAQAFWARAGFSHHEGILRFKRPS
jgi:ribosomal protein S18 acetylase RimI-like enzyme